MERPILGKTTYEQLPPELIQKQKSPWALIIISIVVVLFGIFWVLERQHVLSVISDEPTPLSSSDTIKEQVSNSETTPPPDEIGDLTAAAINTAIPNFANRL